MIYATNRSTGANVKLWKLLTVPVAINAYPVKSNPTPMVKII